MKNNYKKVIDRSLDLYGKFNTNKYPSNYLKFKSTIKRLKWLFDIDEFANAMIYFNDSAFYISLQPYDIKIFIYYKEVSTILSSIHYVGGITEAGSYSYKDFKESIMCVLDDIKEESIVKGEFKCL